MTSLTVVRKFDSQNKFGASVCKYEMSLFFVHNNINLTTTGNGAFLQG